MLQNVFCPQIIPIGWWYSLLVHLNRLVLVEQPATLSTVSVILVETMNGQILTDHPQNFGLKRWLLCLVILMMMRSRGFMTNLVNWSTPAMSQKILIGMISIGYWNWETMWISVSLKKLLLFLACWKKIDVYYYCLEDKKLKSKHDLTSIKFINHSRIKVKNLSGKILLCDRVMQPRFWENP